MVLQKKEFALEISITIYDLICITLLLLHANFFCQEQLEC